MKRSSVLVAVLASVLVLVACELPPPAQSASGVNKANVAVAVGPDGLTVEQRNVRDRVSLDNKPGSIKHLYVISAYSGQVLVYSTVRGKVTSSGKRLTPREVTQSGDCISCNGFSVQIGDHFYYTKEVLEDDGTYGDSVPYIFWFDSKGVYHQHYVEGGQIVHVSDQPLAVKSVVMNFEAVDK
jgi:hypothetical protein